MTSSSDHFLADLERARVLSLQEQVYPTANADPSPQTGGGSKDLAPAVLEQARLHWRYSEVRRRVIEVTGCDSESAQALLISSKGDPEEAINLFFSDANSSGEAPCQGGIPAVCLSAADITAPSNSDEADLQLLLALHLSRKPLEGAPASDGSNDVLATNGEHIDDDEECFGCGQDSQDWATPNKAFRFGCKDHWLCLECARDSVNRQLQEQNVPSCDVCHLQCTGEDIRKLFGAFVGRTKVDEISDLKTRQFLESNASTGKALPCPTPGCPQYLMNPDPGWRKCAVCPQCDIQFCSHCHQSPFHYRLSCAEVQPTTAMYHRWALTDRARYFQRFKAITLAESKFKAETAAAKARADEAKWDEQWKKDNCKLCPHCGKVVNRVDGCSSMTCGKDAADKGGGNVQNGCGKSFNWDQAPAYEPGDDVKFLPPSFEAAAAAYEEQLQQHGKVQEAQHYVTKADLNAAAIHALVKSSPEEVEGTLPQLESSARLPCQVCQQAIQGPRFSCIHCRTGLDVCAQCENDLFEEKVIVDGHGRDHVFQIFHESSSLQ